jgi:hypothetical protein
MHKYLQPVDCFGAELDWEFNRVLMVLNYCFPAYEDYI